MTRSIPLCLALVTGPTLALYGCGDDGTFTPDACPPQNEYDIRQLYAEQNLNDPNITRQRRQIEAQVDEAAKDGCVTKPTNTPPLK